MRVESYSPLEHLGRVVFGSRYSSESIFAMFAAYFDEAGGDDLGFLIVAGYVATIEQWQNFEIDWKLFLAKFDVPCLHMKWYSQNKKCFAKFEGNESLRARFLGTAAEIIGAHAKRCFISIVSIKDFAEVDQTYALSDSLKSPYALAGRSVVGLANNWARNPQTKTLDIEYVFEDGGPDKGGLISAVEALPPYLPAPSFKPGRNIEPSNKWPQGRIGLVQLQAADYLAYEVRKIAYDIVTNKRREPRKSLMALTRVAYDKSSWDTQRLIRLCQGANFTLRKQPA